MTTLYSATMFLDGYIAGENGDKSRLREHLAEPTRGSGYRVVPPGTPAS